MSPQTPQNDAGRMIEPPVCEPIAPRHIPTATAAAEPLDEPPGVRSRFQGLRVGGGSIQANWVVTVLPTITAPAVRSSADDLGVRLGHTVAPGPEARGRRAGPSRR